MNAIGVLLLAAATATGGIGGKPHTGMHWFRSHVVADGPPPGNGGCVFGHPGCAGGAACPGAGGAGGAGAMPGQPGRRFPNVRSQIYFVDPSGMKIGWQTAGPNGERMYLPSQLTVPARYNFTQGYIYRLKISEIPGRPGLQLYPTLEIAPSTPATDAYLTHNPIPAQFTEEDFDQVTAGNFVTKVIYLPDPKYQELAIAGVETLVSTRLEPGVDPILEADRRGTILMIIRIGAIDLEMGPGGASLPAGTAAPSGAPTTVLPPGSLPPGTVAPGTMTEGVPVDTAPVTPAPGGSPLAPPAPDAQPAVPQPPAAPAAPVPPPGAAAQPGTDAAVPVPAPNN